jgi:hypothetical protein
MLALFVCIDVAARKNVKIRIEMAGFNTLVSSLRGL